MATYYQPHLQQQPQYYQTTNGSSQVAQLQPPPHHMHHTSAPVPMHAAPGSYYQYQQQQTPPPPPPPQPSSAAAFSTPAIPSIHQPRSSSISMQQQPQHYGSAPTMNYYQQQQSQQPPPPMYHMHPLPYGTPPQSHPSYSTSAGPQFFMSPPQHAPIPMQQQMMSPQAQQHLQQQQQQQQLHRTAHTPQPQVMRPAVSLTTSTSTPALSSQKQQQPTKAAIAASKAITAAPSLATIFSDLDSRFLVNLPDEELSSFERIMFQLQQAHWFYLDFYSDRNAALPKFSYKAFCETYFKHIPSFAAHISKFEQVYASFNSYLHAVPVCGCILVNPEMTHIVMVRSYIGNSWGFPRGKLDANEDEITCAIREVDEEIGFDCRAWFKGYEIIGPGGLTRQSSSESNTSTSSSALQAQQPSYIEAQSSTKAIRLYILLNVPNNSHFATKTRKEIGQISWIPLSALPSSKGTNNSQGYTFSNVLHSFAPKLRTFMKKLKNGEISGYGLYEPSTGNKNQSNQQQQQSTTIAEPSSGKKSKQNQQQQQAQQQQQQDASSSSNNKSGRKNKDQQQQQQQQQQQPQRKYSSSSKVPLEDSRNAQTFPLSPASLNNLNNPNGGGWSPEQMFAANAKLGVVTTVQEEKIQLPAHLDAQLDAALGRKEKPVNTNQSKSSARKEKKKGGANANINVGSPSDGLSHSISEPLSIPTASKSSSASAPTTTYKPHVPAPELDFGHNPYTTFSNLNLHQTANSNVAAAATTESTKVDSPLAAAASSKPSPVAAVTAAAVEQWQHQQANQKSKKEGKRRVPKNQQQQPSGVAVADAQPAAPIRILKRPTSAAAASAAPASASAPETSFVPSSDAGSFKFDLDAILEPMS